MCEFKSQLESEITTDLLKKEYEGIFFSPITSDDTKFIIKFLDLAKSKGHYIQLRDLVSIWSDKGLQSDINEIYKTVFHRHSDPVSKTLHGYFMKYAGWSLVDVLEDCRNLPEWKRLDGSFKGEL